MPLRRGARPAVVAVLPAALVACGSAASGPTTAGASRTAAETASAAPAASPGAIHLSIIAPARVRAGIPFVVSVSTDSQLQLMAPNGRLIPGTGHFHIFIDRPPLPPGSYTPQEDDIVHSITRNTRIPALPAGTHTLTATLADGMDDITEVVAVSVTVVAS